MRKFKSAVRTQALEMQVDKNKVIINFKLARFFIAGPKTSNDRDVVLFYASCYFHIEYSTMMSPS